MTRTEDPAVTLPQHIHGRILGFSGPAFGPRRHYERLRTPSMEGSAAWLLSDYREAWRLLKRARVHVPATEVELARDIAGFFGAGR